MKPTYADGHGSDFVWSEQTSKALKLRLIVPTWKIADFIFRLCAHANCSALVMRRAPRNAYSRILLLLYQAHNRALLFFLSSSRFFKILLDAVLEKND